MAKNTYKTVKGMRDFYPEIWTTQLWLSNIFLNTGRLFGYSEYEAPVLENINLYLDKSSQELLEKQTFIVNDRGGDRLVLRPELTPSLARLIVAQENELSFPLRWQSWGRFWRYEQPQRGRGREFFQWNIDLIGIDSPEADAEILTIAATVFQTLGISPSDVQIRLSDRQALQKYLSEKLSLDQNQYKTLLQAIDKIDKMDTKVFGEWLQDLGFSQKQISQLPSLLAKPPTNFSPRLNTTLSLIPNDLKDFFTIDLKIVRGLDYYTGLVLEAWATTSTLKRALFGGGRYNNLTQQVGGQKNLPGVGFAIGDMAILEFLKDSNKLPFVNSNPSSVFITTFSPDTYQNSLDLVNFLRKNQVNATLNLDPNLKLGQQFKYASKNNFKYVIVLGPEEIDKNQVSLKNLDTGEQQLVSPDQLLSLVS